MRWVESSYDYLECLVDPTGQGQITSAGMKRPLPIVIHNIYFPSLVRAAGCLGVPIWKLRVHMERGDLSGLPMIDPIYVMRGKGFMSKLDACKHFEVSPAVVQREARYWDTNKALDESMACA